MSHPSVNQALQRLLSAARQPAGFRKLVRNMALDLRYGGRLLGGAVRNPDSDKGFHDFENTDYDILVRIFEGVELGPRDVVVDVGCGKGRLMNWLMSQGFEGRMVGVEVNPSVAEFARGRLGRYRRVEIITGDATRVLPEDGNVFYLYNPFEGPLIKAFAEKLAEMKPAPGSNLRVIYFNPVFLEEFEKQKIWSIRLGGVEPYSKHKVAYLERLPDPAV